MKEVIELPAFIRVFGNSPMIKLLDFLLAERGLYDYSIAEISENSNVSLVITKKLILYLTKIGIVKKTRKVGKAEMFALNEENPLTQRIISIDKEISEFFIKKELEEQKISVNV